MIKIEVTGSASGAMPPSMQKSTLQVAWQIDWRFPSEKFLQKYDSQYHETLPKRWTAYVVARIGFYLCRTLWKQSQILNIHRHLKKIFDIKILLKELNFLRHKWSTDDHLIYLVKWRWPLWNWEHRNGVWLHKRGLGCFYLQSLATYIMIQIWSYSTLM